MIENNADSVVVKYGPHDFPGGPKPYIRIGQLTISVDAAHTSIQKSLVLALVNPENCHEHVSLNFINYGDTQLVYLAERNNSEKIAVLINQPHTPVGVVKSEFENLERLVKLDERFVVRPKSYFSMTGLGHELYTSEYFPGALCVAHDNSNDSPHGVYNPLPYYHFEDFSSKMSSAINSAIIALLVNYYDERLNRGIAKTQISGNDFILTRDFKCDNIYTIPASLKLIAARGFVETSLDGYCDMLKDEFMIGTIRTDVDVLSRKMKINHKSKKSMTKNEISAGIDWGMDLRERRS